jgi:hypothetical protein
VSFFGSTDGLTFVPLGILANTVKANDDKVQIKKFEKTVLNKSPVRYLKIVAKNFGKLPAWHAGKGGEAYIFTDEIEVK